MGLILYRMFSGILPEWPFDWPPPRYDRLRQTLHADFIEFLRRSIALAPGDRFGDAQAMLSAFQRFKSKALNPSQKSKRRTESSPDWESVRHKQFLRHYRGELPNRSECGHCCGPVDELMKSCPWCSKKLGPFKGSCKFPRRCPRCTRGVKSDWRFCAWCYGPKLDDIATREYADARYEGRCSNSQCTRKDLMPWMRYCPWCRRKVQKKWHLDGVSHKCKSCSWGVAKDFWSHCPWCTSKL